MIAPFATRLFVGKFQQPDSVKAATITTGIFFIRPSWPVQAAPLKTGRIRLCSVATTPRKHYGEARQGQIKATAKIAEFLFRKTDGSQAVTAAIFWLKTRGGWREAPQDHRVGIVDVTQLSDAELESDTSRASRRHSKHSARNISVFSVRGTSQPSAGGRRLDGRIPISIGGRRD